jgi:hypothetical protein
MSGHILFLPLNISSDRWLVWRGVIVIVVSMHMNLMKVHCTSPFVAVVSYPNGILPFLMCIQYCSPNLDNLTHASNITSKCNKASAPPEMS